MSLYAIYLFAFSAVFWRAYKAKPHFLYFCMIISFFIFASFFRPKNTKIVLGYNKDKIVLRFTK
jgi:hypothetical protein